MLCDRIKQIGSRLLVLLADFTSAAPTPALTPSLFPSSLAVPSSALSILCLPVKTSIMSVFSQRRYGGRCCSLHHLPMSLAWFYFCFPRPPRPRPRLGQTAFHHRRLSTVFGATVPCHPRATSNSSGELSLQTLQLLLKCSPLFYNRLLQKHAVPALESRVAGLTICVPLCSALSRGGFLGLSIPFPLPPPHLCTNQSECLVMSEQPTRKCPPSKWLLSICEGGKLLSVGFS